MLPISLDDVDGNVMLSNDFVSSLSYFIFIVFKFMYFGKNKYIMIQEDVSVIMFNKIKIVTWIVIGWVLNNGNIVSISINLINCSTMLLSM